MQKFLRIVLWIGVGYVGPDAGNRHHADSGLQAGLHRVVIAAVVVGLSYYLYLKSHRRAVERAAAERADQMMKTAAERFGDMHKPAPRQTQTALKPNPAPSEEIDPAELAAKVTEVFNRFSKPAAYLMPLPPSEEWGRSHLGGVPTLARGMDWPRDGVTKLPLHFLAQIDCAEVPVLPDGPALPETGMLLLFRRH